MITILNQTHKDYFNFLLTQSISNYFDYRAGASLLFLFPYYIQVGLAQIFTTLESIIVDDFQLTEPTNLIQPVRLLQLIYNLLNRELSPATHSLLLPKLNLDRYNNLFGYKLTEDIFFKNTLTQVNSVGLIGNGSLFTTQDEVLPRERLERFFNAVNFEMDNLDKYIDIAVNNSRIEAAAIFCEYFKYPTKLTQQVINKIEIWNLNN
jgi:hypothetical protein